jgi:hypothetical protein
MCMVASLGDDLSRGPRGLMWGAGSSGCERGVCERVWLLWKALIGHNWKVSE